MTRVTLDSNVYLSGFVFGGKPKRVLEMAIDGEIEVAVSDPIIQEVRYPDDLDAPEPHEPEQVIISRHGWSASGR